MRYGISTRIDTSTSIRISRRSNQHRISRTFLETTLEEYLIASDLYRHRRCRGWTKTNLEEVQAEVQTQNRNVKLLLGSQRTSLMVAEKR